MKSLLKGIGIILAGCLGTWASKEGAAALVLFPMGGYYLVEGSKELFKKA